MLSIAHSGRSDTLIKMWKSLYFWRCLTETPRGPGENLTKNYFDLGLGNNIVIKLWKQWWVQNNRLWWRLNYDDYDNLGADTRARNQIMKDGRTFARSAQQCKMNSVAIRKSCKQGQSIPICQTGDLDWKNILTAGFFDIPLDLSRGRYVISSC